MQLLTLLLSAVVASAASIQSRAATPSFFDLTSSQDNLPGLIYPMLMFANGSAYIGNIKYSIYSEPLLLSGGSTTSGLSFTSIHSSPTGWQTFYVFADESKPVGFTQPHSGSIPQGAQVTGFGSYGGLLKLDRGKGAVEEKWWACKAPGEESWQIYWNGGKKLEGLECNAVSLKVGKATECRWPQN